MRKSSNNKPAIKSDLKKLEGKLYKQIDKLDFKFSSAITKLSKKIDKKFDALRNDMVIWKDEIQTANDRLSRKLDLILTEQRAITVNYNRIDNKVANLERFAEKAAPKLQIKFERV